MRSPSAWAARYGGATLQESGADTEEVAPHGYVRLDRLGRWHARRFQSRDSGLTFPTLERAKAWLAKP